MQLASLQSHAEAFLEVAVRVIIHLAISAAIVLRVLREFGVER